MSIPEADGDYIDRWMYGGPNAEDDQGQNAMNDEHLLWSTAEENASLAVHALRGRIHRLMERGSVRRTGYCISCCWYAIAAVNAATYEDGQIRGIARAELEGKSEKHVNIRGAYHRTRNHGEGSVLEFKSEKPDSATFLALDRETWEALGKPQSVNIYIHEETTNDSKYKDLMRIALTEAYRVIRPELPDEECGPGSLGHVHKTAIEAAVNVILDALAVRDPHHQHDVEENE